MHCRIFFELRFICVDTQIWKIYLVSMGFFKILWDSICVHWIYEQRPKRVPAALHSLYFHNAIYPLGKSNLNGMYLILENFRDHETLLPSKIFSSLLVACSGCQYQVFLILVVLIFVIVVKLSTKFEFSSYLEFPRVH